MRIGNFGIYVNITPVREACEQAMTQKPGVFGLFDPATFSIQYVV